MNSYPILWLCLLLNIGLQAQQVLPISILDRQTNEVLPYANAYLLQNKKGANADLSGNARIQLPKYYSTKDSLRCSYIGYKDTTIYVDLSSSKSLQVTLSPESVLLNEVTVKSELSTITGPEIIRKAIKNIKKNYPRQAVQMDGFYRELVYEDDTCVALNEAIVDVHYTRYPQKSYVRKSFRKYYSSSYAYRSSIESGLMFGFPQYFKYYNTPNDEINIIASRVSNYQGAQISPPAPSGGPLAMTAMDKVKYLADFFDKKLLKGYVFKKAGAIYIGNSLCYVIRFRPEQQEKHVFQPWNKKIKYPIYAGTVFVDTEDFSILKFNCRFSDNAKFGIYKDGAGCRQFPDIIDVAVSYKKTNGLLHVQHIRSEQELFPDLENTCFEIKHRYRCIRELTMHSVTIAQTPKHNFQEASLIKDIQYANLMDHPTSYDKDTWNAYEHSGLYPPLRDADIRQLEKKAPLLRQFQDRFVQKNLSSPSPPVFPDTTLAGQKMLIDEYAYMEDIFDRRTLDHIENENRYFNNFLIPFKSRFYSVYNSITDRIKSCVPIVPPPTSHIKAFYAPTGEFGILQVDSTGEYVKTIVNLSEQAIDKNNLKKIALNDSKSKLFFQVTKNGESLLYVQDLHTGYGTAPIRMAFNDIFWLNDDALGFSVADTTDRVHQFFVYDTKDQKKRLLLETPDNEHELDISFSVLGSVIINSVNACSNAFYYLPKTDSVRMFQLSDYGTYTGDHLREDSLYVYMMAGENGKENAIFRRKKPIENTQWKKYISAKAGSFLDDFYIKEGFFGITTIEDGKIKLYTHDQAQQKQQEITLPEDHYSISFPSGHPTEEAVDFYYSSPNTPLRAYSHTDTGLSYEPIWCYHANEEHPICTTKVISVQSHDGVAIPLRLSTPITESGEIKAIFLKVYGAYGAFLEADFDEFEHHLLQHGYAIATAHVRGSRTKGRAWYEAGKVLDKGNSISDYLASARFLDTVPALRDAPIVAYGQSAGGLVIGAAVNQAPKLFDAMIFDYPYLDVYGTMSRPELTLTTTEYCEWGKPDKPEELKQILSYSPYQNIKANDYPPMLFLMGLRDTSTPYWQVLKSVARYRAMNTGNSKIYAHIASGGHPGTIPYQNRMTDMMYIYLFMEAMLRK